MCIRDRLYREGTLVAEDMEKAVFHLKRAADARNSYAQSELGKIYLEMCIRDRNYLLRLKKSRCFNLQ